MDEVLDLMDEHENKFIAIWKWAGLEETSKDEIKTKVEKLVKRIKRRKQRNKNK